MVRYQKKDAYEYENGFILTSAIYRMGNFLSHYELYKKILDVPGEIVELGVFKGSSFIQFGTFRELLENENARKIIGFDVFGKFPDGGVSEGDRHFIEEWNEETKGDFLSEKELEDILNNKGINNYELVKGDILTTVDEYLQANPYLRIALLHIDCDVYAPSKKGLESLFDKVVRGGVIVFDDYGIVEGETIAVDEFLESHPEYRLKRYTFSHMKPSYIVKE